MADSFVLTLAQTYHLSYHDKINNYLKTAQVKHFLNFKTLNEVSRFLIII